MKMIAVVEVTTGNYKVCSILHVPMDPTLKQTLSHDIFLERISSCKTREKAIRKALKASRREGFQHDCYKYLFRSQLPEWTIEEICDNFGESEWP